MESHKSSKNTTTTTTSPGPHVVGLDKISKALRDNSTHHRRHFIASILENSLRSVMTPYCDDFLFFVDRKNRFTIYGQNSTVTLFVPPDHKIRFDNWIDFDYQILVNKIDRRAFSSKSLSEGSLFVALTPVKQRLVVDRVFENGTVLINGVKITEWDLYNDGHIIVHGTEDFFNECEGESKTCMDYEDDTSYLKDKLAVYEDPRHSGSYTTLKMSFQDYPDWVPLTSVKVIL